MYSVTFELETITPMFMAGANQDQIELRPPSFKGILRFWWRAMQEVNKDTLVDNEAKLFGGTGEREGKSPVSLILDRYNLPSRREYLLPHKPACFKKDDYEKLIGDFPQRKDLLEKICIKTSKEIRIDIDSIPNAQKRQLEDRLLKQLKDKAERSKSPAKAIPSEQGFNCIMCFKKDNFQDYISDVFTLAIMLGGFGRRARRGFGSLAKRNVKFKDTSEVSAQLILLSNKINTDIPFVLQNSNAKRILLARSINKVSPEYPRIWNVFIGQHGFNDYQSLLIKIGKASSQYDRNALGNGNPRMASPVIVSVVKIDSMYHPIITQLTSHFENSYPVEHNYEDIHQKFIDMVLD